MKDDTQAFLDALAELTNEHGYVIVGSLGNPNFQLEFKLPAGGKYGMFEDTPGGAVTLRYVFPAELERPGNDPLAGIYAHLMWERRPSKAFPWKVSAEGKRSYVGFGKHRSEALSHLIADIAEPDCGFVDPHTGNGMLKFKSGLHSVDHGGGVVTVDTGPEPDVMVAEKMESTPKLPMGFYAEQLTPLVNQERARPAVLRRKISAKEWIRFKMLARYHDLTSDAFDVIWERKYG